MRILLTISLLLPVILGMKPKEPARFISPRSFYAEMKKLEKPPRVQAFSAVQTATNTTLAGTVCNVTVSATGANNLVVVSVFVLSTTTVKKVYDNAGNTNYAEENGGHEFASAYHLAQAYQFNDSYYGATTVTVETTSSTDFIVIVDEFTGFTGTPTNGECYDVNGYSDQYSSSPALSSPMSPINTGDLVVALCMNDNAYTISAGSGYTIYGTSSYYGSVYMRTEYKLNSSMSESAPFSLSNSSYSVIIANCFKQEDATPPPPPAGKAIRSAGN